jgi:hypothetical protein
MSCAIIVVGKSVINAPAKASLILRGVALRAYCFIEGAGLSIKTNNAGASDMDRIQAGEPVLVGK